MSFNLSSVAPVTPEFLQLLPFLSHLLKNISSTFLPVHGKEVPLHRQPSTSKHMKAIATNKAPGAIGPYSQAIEVGNLVYTSGQLPIDPATGSFPEGGIKEQTRQSLLNVKAILEAAGTGMQNVVKTTVFMADMNDFADMNGVYAEFFAEPFPARSAVAVKTLPKGALVEIEVVAEK